MKILLLCVMFLAGCGGSSFTSRGAEEDGGPPLVETGGAPSDDDAGAPVVTGSGGAPGTGGATPGTGGATPTGGSPSTGGVAPAGTGGSPACTPVTHTNGLGSTWQDCAPLGTYNEAEAMRACKASGASECRTLKCGVNDLIVCGYGTTAYVYGCWGYAGSLLDRAKEGSDSCYDFIDTWG
jgi:hypothetical protein